MRDRIAAAVQEYLRNFGAEYTSHELSGVGAAVLAAMHNPTEAMVEASYSADPGSPAVKVWTAMIDAAKAGA